MLKIDKNSTITTVFSIIIFLTLLEVIYIPDGLATGSMNIYVSLVYLIIGVIWYIYSGFKINVKEILVVGAIAIYIYLWSYMGNTAYIYAVSVIILYLIKEIRIGKTDMFFGIILFSGFILSTIQYIQGIDRVTGFLSSSPTLFSYIILISTAYFSLSKYSFKTILVNLCAIFIIYNTGSRSTLICAILLTIYNIYKLCKNKSIKSRVVILVCFIIPSFLFFTLNFKFFNGFEIREGSEYSDQARTFVIDYYIKDILSSIKTILVGDGGGYTTYLTPKILNLEQDYYPLHQDIVMWIVEYGIIGVFLLSIFLFIINKNIRITRNKKVCVFVLFIIGTFHNILISPICLVLLKVLYNSLESREEKNEKNIYNSTSI